LKPVSHPFAPLTQVAKITEKDEIDFLRVLCVSSDWKERVRDAFGDFRGIPVPHIFNSSLQHGPPRRQIVSLARIDPPGNWELPPACTQVHRRERSLTCPGGWSIIGRILASHSRRIIHEGSSLQPSVRGRASWNTLYKKEEQPWILFLMRDRSSSWFC
jgi:hypothetical protein